MKTKKILFAIAFAAVTLLSGFNYVQNNSEVKLTDLALANVEALASGEGSNCNNRNGYRRILDGNERIYDCCYNEKIGRGKEDCRS